MSIQFTDHNQNLKAYDLLLFLEELEEKGYDLRSIPVYYEPETSDVTLKILSVADEGYETEKGGFVLTGIVLCAQKE